MIKNDTDDFDENEIINEVQTSSSKYDNLNIYQISTINSLCKISFKTKTGEYVRGSGFFIKIPKKKGYYYFLMTCEHVIKEEYISNHQLITIHYFFEQKSLEIELDKKKEL